MKKDDDFLSNEKKLSKKQKKRIKDRLKTPRDMYLFEEAYNKHIAFIYQRVNYFAKKFNQYDRMDDLLQEGIIALIKTVKRFKPEYGIKFITYLQYWLQSYLLKACLNWHYKLHVPLPTLQKCLKYNNLLKSGKTDNEIMEELEISISKFEKIKKMQENINLSSSCFCTNNMIYLENVGKISPNFGGSRFSFEDVDNKITNELHAKNIQKYLTPIESEIILRFLGFKGAPISMNKLRFELYPDFSDKVLTRERIRQIKDQALNKLKKHLTIDDHNLKWVDYKFPERKKNE